MPMLSKKLFQKPRNDLETYERAIKESHPSVPDELCLSCLLLALALSAGIELVQPLLHVFRRADITDVITNTIGGVLGYALWALGNVCCKKRQG